MNDIAEDSLTERMLKMHLTGKETSCISNSREEIIQPDTCGTLINAGAYSPKWFRLRHKAFWLLEGVPLASLEAALAAISLSGNERSRVNLVDTVKKYGEGNWCYEFSRQGMELQKKARSNMADPAVATSCFQAAMGCYSIASYPHFRGDKNAERARLQIVQIFRQYLELSKIKYRELSVPSVSSPGENIKAWLLVPESEEPVPMVLCAGSYESICCDYVPLYKLFFEQHKCALLLMDNPRIGQNQSFALDFDCSRLHREVLDFIADNESCIDNTRIGALGFRFGGNIVTRLSYMRSRLIRASICVGPAINKCFVDKNVLDQLPEVMKTNLANRIDRDVADWDNLKPFFSQFSLKLQGLLGSKTSVPIATIGFLNDPICDESDLDLLARSSEKGKVFIYKKDNLVSSMDLFYTTMKEWFDKYLW
ncbi:MAG: alpha/beta hydrolase [Succinivibrionaceae bacterium]